MQVVERLDIGERFLDRRAHRIRFEGAAGQLPFGAVQPNGVIGRRADADGDPFAFVVGAKFDLRRRRHESKIAAARIHLMKAGADLSPCQTGNRTPVRQAPSGSVVTIAPTWKPRAGISAVLPPAR